MFRSNTAYLPYIQILATIVALTTLVLDFQFSLFIGSLVMYGLIGCLGISIGYHRYLSHNSFKLRYEWLKWPLLSLGCLAGTGSPIGWVAVHREHHRHSDKEKDPHSPHHIGWRSLFANYQYQWDKWPIRELIVDPVHRLVHDRYFLLLIVWFAGLASIGINVLLYIGIIPMALAIWVSTISNYLNHYFGYRTYKTTDKSRNLWITAYLTFGEGWHNNHHAHSNEYRFGKRWWELDLGAWIIEHGLKA
jgi:fatty-acid desaturase